MSVSTDESHPCASHTASSLATDSHRKPYVLQALKNPYPCYELLRRHTPVCYIPSLGAWGISRYDDAIAVLRYPERFSSSAMAKADNVLLGADPPAHGRLRKIVNRALSEHADSIDGGIRSIVNESMARISTLREWDVVEDLAIPVSTGVIAGLLGIEPVHHANLRRWSKAIIASGTGIQNGKSDRETQRSILEFHSFFRSLIEEKQDAYDLDVVCALLAQVNEPNRLTSDQAHAVAELLLIAGSETTSHLISSAVLALLQNPNELSKVLKGRLPVSAVIEEVLRFESPVQYVFRRASATVQIAGVEIPADSLVMVLIGSANRDASRFSSARRFEIDRQPQSHIAFGFGPHYCLGARLARLEAAITLEAVLPWLQQLELVDDLDQIPLGGSTQLRGPQHLRMKKSSFNE